MRPRGFTIATGPKEPDMADYLGGVVIALVCTGIGYLLTDDLWMATSGGVVALVTVVVPRFLKSR
ncbi:hypothetical protein [Streptomyces sp. NPDC005953]|uniref:hypothetical protein n=1 Tax=unclassified Streptomyces TaxID=2593676 RepID=UPI0033CFD171